MNHYSHIYDYCQVCKHILCLYYDSVGGDNLISYKPFWDTLKQKNITTYMLINKHHISSATINRMKQGGGISTMKIDDFCRILDCRVEDIIEYVNE